LSPRLLDGINLHLKISQGKYEAPICLFYLRYYVDRLLTKLSIVEAKVLFSDLDLPAVVVKKEVSEKRLSIGCRQ
jgi:hypothetical protein